MIPQFSINYSVDPNAPYGPTWSRRQPPGLPDSARLTSRRAEATPHVQRETRRVWNSIGGSSYEAATETVVNTVAHMATTESGAMFALPAQRFNSPATTAWGVFQFNTPIWSYVTKRYLAAEQQRPWQANTQEEILVPIMVYRDAAKSVIDAGGSSLFVARGIRIWQRSQSIFRVWLKRAKNSSFEISWNNVDNIAPSSKVGKDIKATVDRHLRDAGVL